MIPQGTAKPKESRWFSYNGLRALATAIGDGRIALSSVVAILRVGGVPYSFSVKYRRVPFGEGI
jgi:hypothetical protein